MIPAVTDILLKEKAEEIVLDYTPQTHQVSYSIADFSGNVLLRGELRNEKKIHIGSLKKGMYTLCIVDGDKLIKNRFHKDQ
jgi:hypothetical protein